MTMSDLLESFQAAARKVGAEVTTLRNAQTAADFIRDHCGETILLPACASLERIGLAALLRERKCTVVTEDLRTVGPRATDGVTGANFAIADTGTIVLESTPEPIRLATTLPARHFVLLDPRKIVADGLAAVSYLRQFHERQPRNYLAYISGPSRTADIERVLTIGVHGPRELHILVLEGLSEDPLEI